MALAVVSWLTLVLGETLELLDESGAADLEQGCGAIAVSARTLEGVIDQSLLEIGQGGVEVDPVLAERGKAGLGRARRPRGWRLGLGLRLGRLVGADGCRLVVGRPDLDGQVGEAELLAA